MKKIIILSAFMLGNLAVHAQTINTNELPEYIVVTAEETKLLGGIGLTISNKNSPYKDILEELEDVITIKKQGEGVRNLTDLFNTMFKYGFEYINAFQSTAFSSTAGNSKSRSNMVFKKNHNQK